MEGWAERRQAHYLCCRVCETRLVRTQRGAARPMTRDARLSALHRGDFRPGAALPSPALPPDPYSDAPRSQVIMPGGRCPGPPEPAVTSRGRRTPLPAPPFRTVSGRRPSMSEDGNPCTINSLRSQHRNANCSRMSQGPPNDRRATTRSRLALAGPHGHTAVGQRRLDLPTVPSRTCR
jgi:hypothetical protein